MTTREPEVLLVRHVVDHDDNDYTVTVGQTANGLITVADDSGWGTAIELTPPMARALAAALLTTADEVDARHPVEAE